MASAKFVFYLTYLFLEKIAQMTDQTLSIRQERHFVSANIGDDVTLECFYEVEDSFYLYWYKQPLGQKPRLISTFFSYDDYPEFHDEFKKNPRFTLDTGRSKNHLTITDLHISDSATYYCAVSSSSVKMKFAEGTLISIKGSGLNVPALVHQSQSESVQSGDSVTLNCKVQTGTCDGEHSVYWFKNSEESHPGLIYTHGGRNDQCERKPDTQTHTCVYNLPLKNLNSHAGTYYCAVASCGHIVFGNGTKLDFEDEVDYFCGGSLAFTTILVVLLAFSVCMMNKRNRCQSSECQARRSAPSTANAEDYQNVVHLYHAASLVSLHKRSRSLRDPTWSECVYYSVKQ